MFSDVKVFDQSHKGSLQIYIFSLHEIFFGDYRDWQFTFLLGTASFSEGGEECWEEPSAASDTFTTFLTRPPSSPGLQPAQCVRTFTGSILKHMHVKHSDTHNSVTHIHTHTHTLSPTHSHSRYTC